MIQRLCLKDKPEERSCLLKRYATCPVCEEKTVLDIPPDILKNAKRFPYTVKVIHNDHHFYVNLDSKGRVGSVLHPDMVE
jgi:hypothetical protein